MYSLTIHFGPNAMMWSFLFKEKEKATAWYESITELPETAIISIEDDYGQRAIIKNIQGILCEDMDAGEEARIQRSLSQARGQAKANERAKTDPILSRASRGPGMLTPFGNGQFQ